MTDTERVSWLEQLSAQYLELCRLHGLMWSAIKPGALQMTTMQTTRVRMLCDYADFSRGFSVPILQAGQKYPLVKIIDNKFVVRHSGLRYAINSDIAELLGPLEE